MRVLFSPLQSLPMRTCAPVATSSGGGGSRGLAATRRGFLVLGSCLIVRRGALPPAAANALLRL